MKTPLIIASILVLVSVSACDAVRIPGRDDGEASTPASDPVSHPAPQQPSDTADTVTDPDPVIPQPDPVSQVDPEPETPEAPIVVTDLAQIAATACGLELTEGEEPTRTMAELSTLRAEEAGPQQESLFSTAVAGSVGAANIVATLDTFPGIVKMEPVEVQPDNLVRSGHCGATRIADNWFLTAAHCVDDPYDEIRFIAGTVNLDQTENATTFIADRALCHAGYSGQTTSMVNDIALIRVPDEVVPALATVPIASYGATDELLTPINYETARMAGWGSTRYGSLPSDQLLTANLRLVTASPGVILLESINEIGPCEGDSGGPLYIEEDDGRQRVVGVLSNVQAPRTQAPCSGTYRAAYTNVAGYVDWIDTVISACEGNDGLCD